MSRDQRRSSETEANSGLVDNLSAWELASCSYRWYINAARRSRRMARTGELVAIIGSSSVAVVVAIWPNAHFAPALLGLLVATAAGANNVFHWRENYLRYSVAREALNRQMRLYRASLTPYDNESTRDGILVQEVSAIEETEMAGWVQIASTPTTTPPP
jgi:hypothetical protein